MCFPQIRSVMVEVGSRPPPVMLAWRAGGSIHSDLPTPELARVVWAITSLPPSALAVQRVLVV